MRRSQGIGAFGTAGRVHPSVFNFKRVGRELEGMVVNKDLDIQITYRAILDAALGKGFISYSDLAKEHGARKVDDIRNALIAQLNDLLEICYRKDLPAMSVIVVADGHEELSNQYLGGFVGGAQKAGWVVQKGKESEFADQQKKELIEWAPGAPYILKVEDSSDGSSIDFTGGDKPSYWAVGAFHGKDSEEVRFLKESIWENGDDGKFEARVREVKVGDYLIMKSVFSQIKDLPFDSNGKRVGVMRIKATGRVTKSTTDGRKIEVDWKPISSPRDWYIFTYRHRLQRLDTSRKQARELIKFVFDGKDQDFGYWLNQDWVRKKGYKVHDNVSGGQPIAEGNLSDNESGIKPYGIDDIMNDGCFVRREHLDNALSLLRSKKNLILQGPPGTGKTWLAKRLANAFIRMDSSDTACDQVRRIQFHPSLSYEDFIRGWRPGSEGKLNLVDGTFLKAINAARLNIDSDHVIVIDEINRGNTAQIFGEMLTLIESDKRSESEAIEIAYPRYDGERIHVPDNLHIIGTMNIADRSLALVDLALRRRFAFMSLEPALDSLWAEWCVEMAGFDQEVVGRVGAALRSLNEHIANDRVLGSQYRIGHSYVTPSSNEVVEDDKEWFRRSIVSGIGPLLHEYWFENPDVAKEHVDKLLESVR